MTTQIALKLPDGLLSAVDELVAQGRFDSRSAAVRAGIESIVADARRAAVDRAFAVGFARVPDTADELDDAERLARSAIDDEPWQPWW